MTSFNETSLTLLEQVRANHAEAWDRLVDLYAPLVRYWGRRSQLGDEDVAEVFQETFRAVATHIQSFRRDRKDDSFRGWLRTITTNKIRDHFRRLDGQAIAEGGSVGQMKLAAISDPLSDEDENSEQDIMRASVHRMLEMVLLDVPRYDFNWQLRYLLDHPLRLPIGTRVRCTAWYDNSSNNPANPNPQQEVRWGDQTTDEMLIGFYSIVEKK